MFSSSGPPKWRAFPYAVESGMRGFRFTLREMLLVSAVVGLAIGWWLDHRRLSAVWEQKETELRVFLTPQVR
jgi:hypothetical protein